MNDDIHSEVNDIVADAELEQLMAADLNGHLDDLGWAITHLRHLCDKHHLSDDQRIACIAMVLDATNRKAAVLDL